MSTWPLTVSTCPQSASPSQPQAHQPTQPPFSLAIRPLNPPRPTQPPVGTTQAHSASTQPLSASTQPRSAPSSTTQPPPSLHSASTQPHSASIQPHSASTQPWFSLSQPPLSLHPAPLSLHPAQLRSTQPCNYELPMITNNYCCNLFLFSRLFFLSWLYSDSSETSERPGCNRILQVGVY